MLIFTKPVSKFDYLGGKWLASFVVTLFVFSGLVWGGIIGTFMPWADKTRLAPVHLLDYMKPFFQISVINIFFLGALFYCVAALSRRITVVYLQGVSVLALYLILALSVVTTNKLDRFWPSVFDPLGMVFMNSIMRYWTVVERNSKLLEWSGPFLYNRLLWTGFGILALLLTYALFPMSAETLTGKRANKKAKEAAEAEEQEKKARPRAVTQLPQVTQTFSSATTWQQFVSMTRLRLQNILREIPFRGIAILMVIFCAINGEFAGEVSGVKVWPVTYLMLNVLQGGASLFMYIVMVLYAGELMWRERDVNFDQIHDALPVKDWTDWLSKFAALVLVEMLLLTIVMVVGIVMQVVAGYYRFEMAQYLTELLPHRASSDGHGGTSRAVRAHDRPKQIRRARVVIGFIILMPILYRYGIENRLVMYGEVTPYTYSDMNGYGHFAKALLWISVYWLAIGGVLGVLAISLARRGTDASLQGTNEADARAFSAIDGGGAAFCRGSVGGRTGPGSTTTRTS